MRSLSMRSGERGAVLSLFVAGAAFACSGEGAGRAIAISGVIGLACLALSIAATIMCVKRALKLTGGLVKTAAGVAVLLLILHPTIWLGVTSGDCGYTVRILGPVTVALQAGLAGFLMIKKPVPAPTE